MKRSRFFLALAVACAAIAASVIVHAQASFSVGDQVIIDRAVSKVEKMIAQKGESSRASIVSKLHALQLKYATDARVQKYMPRLIYFVQNPNAVTYPAGANYVDPVAPSDNSNDPVACTKEYVPVCGSNGVTYANACMAGIESGVNIAHTGACRGDEVAICTMEYAPVCGSNGVTYGNSCMAKAASGVTITHNGECVSASTGATASGTTAKSCERGTIDTDLGTEVTCSSSYSPLIVSNASSATGSLGVGTQYMYPFSMRTQSGNISLKRLVLEITGVIGGKTLDSVTYRSDGRVTDYDNTIQSSSDFNSRVSNFVLLINGLNADSSTGIKYRTVKSGSAIYLVLDFQNRIILSTTTTNFELKLKLGTATYNDYLRIGIPMLSTEPLRSNPSVFNSSVSDTSNGMTGIVWSPQLAANHSEDSDDYFNDWGVPAINGYLLAPVTYLMQ